MTTFKAYEALRKLNSSATNEPVFKSKLSIVQKHGLAVFMGGLFNQNEEDLKEKS